MYSDRIFEERQDAHDAHVANKIIDMMDKLRLSANTNSPRRWIWELLQNAKDVCNSTGKVKVKVHLDEEDGILEFSHNGKPFSTKNVVFLIEQVSTKERDNIGDDKDKATGKFGTGFLTTHLLSEVVLINGYLRDDKDPIRRFKITVDRSGKNKEEIIKAIHKSFKELEKSEVINDPNYYDSDEYNTTFRYVLNKKGLEVAKIGIKDLKMSVPYVLAFTPKIEEIYIQNENIRYSLYEEINPKVPNSIVYNMKEVQGTTIKNKYVLLVKDKFVSIATPIEVRNEKIWIKSFNEMQPKIFCEFPLVGTNDFTFPLIVNSKLFNPTEPRDGIFLTNNENEKIEENKRLILIACNLYESLLNYASINGWLGIYNITNINRVQAKEWLSTEWLKENIVNKLKEYIKYYPIIDNALGKRIALYNSNGKMQVEIPNQFDEEVRNYIWELSSKLIPNELPCKEDIHYWYNSLWSECKNLDLKRLTNKIEQLQDKVTLDFELEEGITSEEWLNEYYELIKNDKGIADDIAIGKYAVLPNQNGVFRKSTELLFDDEIDKEYKEILNLLGEDCKEYLLDKNIDIDDLIKFEKINSDSIILKIEKKLKHESDEGKTKVYSYILVLYNEEHKKYNKQIKIIDFANKIFGDLLQGGERVKSISMELLESSIKHMSTRIADTISNEQNIYNFANHFEFKSNNEALEWLKNFIEYLVDYDFDNLLNKSVRPILPNQNGCFVIKDDLFLDDGEIDEELKDIATEIGYDIRNELLDKMIFLKLPENRERHAKDLADSIVRFVKSNYSNGVNQTEDIKLVLKKILIWIDENIYIAKKVFPEICEHKYWLYDDKEIALNIKKAEAYDVLMKKYNIENTESLEKVLQYKQAEDLEVALKENITEDLLIQSGIDSHEALQVAMDSSFFADNFMHISESDGLKFDYVNEILERSRKNVMDYLQDKKEYDLSSVLKIDKTIYMIKKNDEEIYIIIRPSDYGQVILYYDSEKDILDYEKDWELWVEDGINSPQRITFGKMLKLTGINKIPLKKVR
ncbi:ATP-binding protein [Clostridium saccharobutylicum]|uniref:Histidine kinase-, DNA gyrase B-, and HSP90-like ATPase n=1 Tax=Clostridium saccharobutylicum TaxID=169679 RepID=A0A1S8NDZ9_CLOSA|nr:ATP-binding protein [Clostridium saccharobutylicum]OOM14501.1 hypothetical protein CLOSAC_13810 [Clostridium saccharobutylicum]